MQIQTKPKSALCLSDLCCVGRCSLSITAPVLAAMGVQPCMLPTAIYSAHPACIKNAAECKTDAFCESALLQLEQNGVDFNCVYVGFIGGGGQAACAESAFSKWNGALKILDPVMGDGGKLYSLSSEKLCGAVKRLCKYADIITPNLTESAVLLDLEPSADEISEQELKNRVFALTALCKSPIITGVPICGGRHITAGIDGKSGKYFTVECNYINAYYPGTGDLFASALAGALLCEKNLYSSVCLAVRLTEKAVAQTYAGGGIAGHGLWIENILKNDNFNFDEF